jgi:hypothetical protein
MVLRRRHQPLDSAGTLQTQSPLKLVLIQNIFASVGATLTGLARLPVEPVEPDKKGMLSDPSLIHQKSLRKDSFT